jgi:hypothetical protein
VGALACLPLSSYSLKCHLMSAIYHSIYLILYLCCGERTAGITMTSEEERSILVYQNYAALSFGILDCAETFRGSTCMYRWGREAGFTCSTCTRLTELSVGSCPINHTRQAVQLQCKHRIEVSRLSLPSDKAGISIQVLQRP